MTKSIVAIIPLFNGRDFIETSLRSVLGQTRLPDEVIIVDDGSTDDGVELARAVASGYENVRFLSKANGGQSSARNLAVSQSKCDFIAFLDQDDWWYPEHLEVLEKVALKPRSGKFGWVYSDLDEYDRNGGLIVRKMLSRIGTEHPKQTLNNCIARDMYVLPSASLISRDAFEFIGGFDERLRGYEDDDLFIRLFHAGFTNRFVKKPLSGWRIHGGSTSYSPIMARSAMIYAEKLMNTFPDDVSRSRFYRRDLLTPRFTRAAIENYRFAVQSQDQERVDKAFADIDRLVPYMRWRKKLLIRIIRSIMAFPPFLGLSTLPLVHRSFSILLGKNR